jgi:hypothetical protein
MYVLDAPAIIATPPTEEEIRLALNYTVNDTLPFEGWDQPAQETFLSGAAGIAARSSELLWDEDLETPGPDTDAALDRWWAASRQILIDELAGALLNFAATQPDEPLGLALRAKRLLGQQDPGDPLH